MRRAVTLAAGLAALSLAGAGPATAQSNKIYKDFQNDGQINPCSYSKGQLQKGLHDLPPDIQQYAPGLADQLRQPCASAAPALPPATTPEAKRRQEAVLPTATSKPGIPSPPAPKGKVTRGLNVAAPVVTASPTGSDVPVWLQVLLGLVAVGTLGWVAAVRFGGFDPEHATRGLRAALAQLGERFSRS
jgi:hypothetical protein